jgi:hypothetical protein
MTATDRVPGSELDAEPEQASARRSAVHQAP